MSQYHLKPLAESDGVPAQFRILTILSGAGKREDDIQCTIEHHPFSIGSDIPPSVESEALSWTWGAENERLQEIQIVDAVTRVKDHKTGPFAVKPNLLKALQYLRLPDKDRRLWVDYVCINQKHASEKNLQVKFISDIYGKATNVCIWLGDHSDDSQKAMDFIKHKVNDLGSFLQITKEEESKNEWKALAALMDRPWFSRRWVVQELALAKTATVHCAEQVITWIEFETAVSLFHRDADHLAGFFRGLRDAGFDPEFFGDVGQMGATRLVQLRSNPFRFDDTGKIMEYRLTLTDLVSNLWSFSAKEPHDLIYAILSLARDTYNRVQYPKSSGQESAQRSQSAAVSQLGKRKALGDAGPSTTDDGDPAPADDSNSEPRAKRPRTDGTMQTATSSTTSSPSPSSSVTGLGSSSHAIPLPTKAGITTQEAETLRKWGPVMLRNFNRRVAVAKTFEVDYDQPFFVLCKEFLLFTIDNDRHNLDILLRPWAPASTSDPPDTLPSCIPQVRNAAFKRVSAKYAPGSYHTRRVNPDLLVGQTTHGLRTSYYNACRSTKAPRASWSLSEDQNDRHMTVSGFILDKIGTIQDASQAGNVPREWLELGGWSGLENKDSQAHDELWRTLVADRGEGGINVPDYYRTAFVQAIQDSPEGIQNRLKDRGHPILAEFLRRVEAVVTNRRLFKCDREGHLGLAPKQAQTGDYIYIIRGVSVPVVLRPIDPSDPKSICTVIGECYVHTMMDGRAIDVQEQRLEGFREQLKGDDQLALQLQPAIKERRTHDCDEVRLRAMKNEVLMNKDDLKAFSAKVKMQRKAVTEERDYEEILSRLTNNRREETLLTLQKFVLA